MVWMRAVVTATSGMTEVVEATDQAVAAAVDPPAGTIGTVVLAATETATETEIMTIIVLGAVGPLAHLYADVLAAARARTPLVLMTEGGHVLDLLDGDLGLGVARLLLP